MFLCSISFNKCHIYSAVQAADQVKEHNCKAVKLHDRSTQDNIKKGCTAGHVADMQQIIYHLNTFSMALVPT